MNCKIHFEGRDKKEVIREGNTIRVDIFGTFWDHSDIVELTDWNYEIKSKHQEKEYNVYYIELISKNELSAYKGNRFVTKNSYELAIENAIFDEKRNCDIPFWYIYDKATDKTLDGYEDAGEGARQRLKKDCDELNKLIRY